MELFVGIFDSAYWAAPLFKYCERAGQQVFWAEPLNALTNIAFVLAAVAGAIRLMRRVAVGAFSSNNHLLFARSLIILVFLIGVGSFFFHTFATRLAQLGDIVPIGLFMFAYLGFVLRCLGGWSLLMSMLGVLSFMAISVQAGSITCGGGGSCFNGSVAYLPALAGLLIAGVVFSWRSEQAGRWLLGAGVIFGLSLLFRTVDMLLCDEVQIGTYFSGTHFIWHLLNGLMLYLLLALAIDHLAADHELARG